jgi:hypothetical protein
MRRRWTAVLGTCLLAITVLGGAARGMAPSDPGAELRRSFDDSASAFLLASVPRAAAAIEPSSRDGRSSPRQAARLGLGRERSLRDEPVSLAASHRSLLPFRPLRYAPRAADASTDPH